MQHIAKLTPTQHWTANSTLRTVRSISSDFVAQLETRMEQFDGFTHTELAKRLSVTLGRVSQVMNSPGNFTLKNAVLYAGAVNMKVAVVAYHDDPQNRKAPISGDVFRACWEKSGCPKNMFEVDQSTTGVVMRMWGTAPVNMGRGIVLDMNRMEQTDHWKRFTTNVPLEIQ